MNIFYKKIHIVLTAMFLLAPGIAIGQEFIKEPHIKTVTSIVRERDVANQEWVTFSYAYHYGFFSLIGDAATSAPVLELPHNYYVSDFEIYNDTVYFCGYIDSSITIGIFGYFSLASFPATTVYCCRIAGLLKTEKLVVFNNCNKPHPVFTGYIPSVHNINRSVLVDAIETSTDNWDFYIGYNHEINYLNYDDVAVTDDYIIATSRIIDLDSGLIHYFFKPTSYTSIFPFHRFFRAVGYNTISPILITACFDKYFATLCKEDATHFVMSRYLNLANDLSLKTDVYRGDCLDINFDMDDKNIEVLIYDIFVPPYGGSIIMHYDQMLTTSATIPTHLFSDKKIHSIDYLTHNQLHFIASGAEGDFLRLYRYKYNEWHDCTIKKSREGKEITNKGDYYDYRYEPMITSENAQEIDCMIDNSEISPFCEQSKN